MDKSIKICFLTASLETGGAERNVVNIVNSLDGNFQVSVVASCANGGLKNKINNNVKIVDFKSRRFLVFFFKLCKYLQIEKPDILVSNLTYVNILSIIACFFAKAGMKIILIEHTTVSLLPETANSILKKLFAKFILPSLIKILYPKADAIVCVSEGVADDLAKIIGNREKIEIIYNPIPGDEIRLESKEQIGEDESFFTNKEPVVISVGRLIKAKDYPNLFKAFKIVLLEKRANLVIVGDGPEKENLKKYISSLGLDNNIHLLGFKKNPYKYIANSSVFVLSSFREGFGNVIVEAMACGTPVVSTDCKSGPNEIIKNGENGLLVPVRDENSLASAILSLLENSDLSEKLSKAGKERADFFSVERSLNNYNNLFNKVITHD
jgi:glycosyltransferase involved in cell wall biosynthesis